MAGALVVGASGLVGGHVLARLAAGRGAGPLIGTSGPRPLAAGGLVPVDLTDARAAAALAARTRPSLVVWCAMARPAAPAGTEAALARAGLTAVLDALPTAVRLIYVSTDSVLPGECGPYAEDAPTRPGGGESPLDPYIDAKILGETIALGLGRRALVVRSGPVFGRSVGGRLDGRSLALVEAWHAGAVTAQPTNLLRTWVHASDLAATLVAAWEAGMSGVLHAGPSRGMSRYAYARTLARAAGIDPARVRPCRIDPDDARRRGVRLDLRLDTTRAHRLGGIARTPRRALRDGV